MISMTDGGLGELYAWVDKAEKTTLAQYRRGIWGLFLELLKNTPQGTGKAVANWRIGIEAPDLSFDNNAGDEQEILDYKSGSGQYLRWGHRKKGDQKWIDEAIAYNRHLVQPGQRNSPNRIQLGDRVFFSNNVQGDTDLGESGTNYLASLQNPEYWKKKLRFANQPYETVARTLMNFKWSNFKMGGASHLDALFEETT